MNSRNRSTIILFLFVLFSSFMNQRLCACSVLSENGSSILLHDEGEIRVGIVLDMESWVGRSIHSFVSMAISDFYALNNMYRTRIILHTRDSKGDPLQAISAVLDLLNNIKVQAIIGPESYLEAKLLAPIADKSKVPIFSFAGSPSMNYPFLFQIKENESVMAKTVTSLVESFQWKNVIYLYEDTDSGREVLSYFLESFHNKKIRVSHATSLPPLATDDQISRALQKVMTTSHMTKVVVFIEISSELASRLFLIAKKLGMMSEKYSWIITHKTLGILQSDLEVIDDSLQGVSVIGVRPYIPSSGKMFNLTARWYNECYIKYPSLASKDVSVLAVWAYDTVWALAESVQRLGVGHLSMLVNEVSKSEFKGVSGEFRLVDGRLVSNGFKVVNVIGGSWMFPEGSRRTTAPKRRVLEMSNDTKLRVGVLTRRKFKYFIDADHDVEKNVTNATGFSVDVFNTCIRGLPHEVTYELVPFAIGTYDDLIKKVYAREIDAILGDSTILANRSQYVDFTATYTDFGIGTLARINDNDMWIFLKALDLELWLSTAAFAILTGFVVWAIESMDQESESSPALRIGATFWFILMTLFFAQREKLSSNLSKFVVFVWLLVVLILISSYTATLASLLTVEQFELASKGGTVGFHGGSFVAGVTVSNLNFEDYRRKPYYSYEDYAEALLRGGKRDGADAIVDEIPYIKMFLGKCSTDYAMISSEPSTSGFAFIFRKGSPLVSEMSRQIAKIREDGTLRLLEKKWFEKQSLSSQDPPTKPKTLNFGRFRGLFIISGISSALALLLSLICLLRAKLEIHSIIFLVLRRNLVATLRYFLRKIPIGM